jgi:hypothetical protein
MGKIMQLNGFYVCSEESMQMPSSDKYRYQTAKVNAYAIYRQTSVLTFSKSACPRHLLAKIYTKAFDQNFFFHLQGFF